MATAPLSAEVRLLGVIGWPIGHSRSPAMQNAALAALGLPWVYLPFAVEPARLATAIAGAAALGVRGLNVTIPHKAAALSLCEPDALAVEVGAVNTLTFEDGRVLGQNTDVYGLGVLLEKMGSSGPALVLGAGGSARAAVAALRRRGQDVIVVSRRVARLVIAGIECASAAWGALPSLLPSAGLVVDTTGRGLTHDEAGIDCALLPENAQVVDLVVTAGSPTPLVAAARARGLVAENGAEMLVHQGAKALERWTGMPAPVDVMRRAL